MRYALGLSAVEIGKATGLSVPGVRSRLARGLERRGRILGMTEQTNDPMDVYGRRLGPELRALADRAIQPFDPVDIAHAVAVGRTRRAASFGADWFRGVRPLIWVILILVAALLLALWAVVLSRPPAPAPFVPGSIAFARDGDLYVASPDGSQPVKMADGEPGSSEISNFAFSPDRLYLAFTQMNDPATGTEALYIASADGTVRSMYSGGGPSGSEPGVGLTFGWAPDSRRLAVYPGKNSERDRDHRDRRQAGRGPMAAERRVHDHDRQTTFRLVGLVPGLDLDCDRGPLGRRRLQLRGGKRRIFDLLHPSRDGWLRSSGCFGRYVWLPCVGARFACRHRPLVEPVNRDPAVGRVGAAVGHVQCRRAPPGRTRPCLVSRWHAAAGRYQHGFF